MRVGAARLRLAGGLNGASDVGEVRAGIEGEEKLWPCRVSTDRLTGVMMGESGCGEGDFLDISSDSGGGGGACFLSFFFFLGFVTDCSGVADSLASTDATIVAFPASSAAATIAAANELT